MLDPSLAVAIVRCISGRGVNGQGIEFQKAVARMKSNLEAPSGATSLLSEILSIGARKPILDPSHRLSANRPTVIAIERMPLAHDADKHPGLQCVAAEVGTPPE